jgi:hypothetical protein
MFSLRCVNFSEQCDSSVCRYDRCFCVHTPLTTSLITDHMQALNPKTENLKPLRPFLDMAPVRILGLLLDVKAEVRVLVG